MKNIKYKKGQTVKLTVINAGNMLVGYMAENPTSGRRIYQRETIDNPKINDSISISDSFRGAKEELMLLAASCGKSVDVNFLIEIDGVDAYRVAEKIPKFGCKSWPMTFTRT